MTHAQKQNAVLKALYALQSRWSLEAIAKQIQEPVLILVSVVDLETVSDDVVEILADKLGVVV